MFGSNGSGFAAIVSSARATHRPIQEYLAIASDRAYTCRMSAGRLPRVVVRMGWGAAILCMDSGFQQQGDRLCERS
jgi:hypothetical protein